MENGKDQNFFNNLLASYEDAYLIFNKSIKDPETNEDKVEQIKSTFLIFFNNRDRLEKCIKTLQKVILFCDTTSDYKAFFNSYWDFVDLESGKQKNGLISAIESLLSNFESHIKPILCFGDRKDILDNLKEQKGTLGPYLNALGLISGDSDTSHLFTSILRFRNWHIHKSSSDNEDLKYGKYMIPVSGTLVDLKRMIALCFCGLLLIVDKYRDNIERYLVEHSNDIAETGSGTVAEKFDFEKFIGEYVAYLSDHCRKSIKENVGKVGSIGNDRSDLISLQLKKEVSSDESEYKEVETDGEDNESRKTDIPMEGMEVTDDRVNFILGKPGAGKSTILLYLISRHCKKFKNGNETKIPVLLNLNSISNGENINTAIVRTLKNIGVYNTSNQDIFRFFEEKLKSGNVIFYIDGLNEIRVSNPGSFMAELEEFISIYGSCRFYLTGRKYEFAEYRSVFSRIDGHGIYEVREITIEQVLTFMKGLGALPGIIAEFEKNIENARISKLLGTPLNFYMIARLLMGSDPSVLTINNRGELLKGFIDDMFKKSSNNNKGNNSFHTYAPMMLQKVAREMFDQGKQSIDLFEVAGVCKLNDALTLEIIDTLQGLNILRQEEVFAKKKISFFVDTYQEYFLAQSLIDDFTEGRLNIKTDDKNSLETLKLMVEIINADKKRGIVLGRNLVSEIERQGNTGNPQELNSNLRLLATIVSGLPEYTAKNNPNARLTVENLVMNYLVNYRTSNVSPDLWKDFDYIHTMLECASLLSSRHILKEILSLYWMDVAGVMNQNEINSGSSGSAFQRYRLRSIIISECSNITELYKELHTLHTSLLLPYRKSATKVLKFIRELFIQISTSDQKTLYRDISYQIEKNRLRNDGEDIYMKNDASFLLLCIEDIDYLERFNMDKNNTKIPWQPIHALMRLYSNPRLSEIIFSDKFINRLYLRREQLLYMIRFHLFRNHIPRALHNLLFGNGTRILKYIKSADDPTGVRSFKELLDILPITSIPEHIARQHYYENTYRFILNRFESDEEESFEALNYRILSKEDSQMRLIIKNVRTSFVGKYALFNINGEKYPFRIIADKCENIIRDTECVRERVLTIENHPGCITPGNMGEVQFAELKDEIYTPVSIDKRKMEDEEYFDRKLYQPISTGSIQDNSCLYNLIGQKEGQAWITCDPLINKHDLTGKTISLKDDDKSIELTGKIEAAGKLGHDIITLTLRSKSIPEIGRSGLLAIISNDGKEHYAEYIYSSVQHRIVTIRLFYAPDLMNLCQKEDVRFRIDTFDMLFESIGTIKATGTFCIEISTESGNPVPVPAKGRMHINTDTGTMLLVFDNSYRIDNPYIEKGKISCMYIDPEENRAEFFIDDKRITRYSEHFLSIPGSSLHLKIQRPPVILQWMVQITLVLENRYPKSGYLYLSDAEGAKFRYTTISEKENIIRIWPEEGYKDSVDKFMKLLTSEDQRVIVEGHGRRLVSSVQECNRKKEEEYMKILITDFASTDTDDINAWTGVKDTPVRIVLQNHFGNIKKNERGHDEVRFHIISYTQAGRDVIRIQKPLTPLDDIFIRLDGGLMCSASVINSSERHLDIRLKTLNGLTPKIRHDGFVTFYRKSSDGYKEEYVGYETLYEVVNFEKPEKYHADICNILEEELIEKLPKVMNQGIIEFFRKKSRSFMLVSNPLLFERIKTYLEERNDYHMQFDVCKVQSSDNQVQLTAISPFNKCEVNSSDTSPAIADHNYAKGDYILYEQNHKVHYLSNPPKHTSLGFHTGTVIKFLKDRDGRTRFFIKVHEIKGEKDEFYCPEECCLGTIVSFFHGINTNDKGDMAIDTKVTGTREIKTGIIRDIWKDNTEGSDLHYISMEPESPEIPVKTFTISEESLEWEVASKWKTGDKCNYFMYDDSEMYLKF